MKTTILTCDECKKSSETLLRVDIVVKPYALNGGQALKLINNARAISVEVCSFICLGEFVKKLEK